jgi:hypothetical protein
VIRRRISVETGRAVTPSKHASPSKASASSWWQHPAGIIVAVVVALLLGNLMLWSGRPVQGSVVTYSSLRMWLAACNNSMGSSLDQSSSSRRTMGHGREGGYGCRTPGPSFTSFGSQPQLESIETARPLSSRPHHVSCVERNDGRYPVSSDGSVTMTRSAVSLCGSRRIVSQDPV